MARSQLIKEYNTFIAGIVTEASPLTFPENASLDEANFILNRDGSRERRLGLDYETGYVLSDLMLETEVGTGSITTHTWNSISGNTSSNLIIVQTGHTIHFYDADQDAISSGKFDFTIDLNDFAVDLLVDTSVHQVSTAEVRGYLVITSPVVKTFYVYYDKENSIFATGVIDIEIRDLIGLDDGLEVNENPITTLTDEHKYNLLNQGWDNAKIDTYNVAESQYPSNSQVWTAGKNSSGAFDPPTLDQQYFGNSPAPKGHYIHNLFNRRYYINDDGVVTNSIANLTINTIIYTAVSNILTVTLTATHGLSVGDKVELSGVDCTTAFPSRTATTLRNIMTKSINKSYTIVEITSTTSFTINFFAKYSGTLLFEGGNVKVIRSTITQGTETLIKEDSEANRFSSVASFAGRAFYSGIEDSAFSNYILFSRILRDEKDLGICYQEADPTSETVSDIIDTDGGFIIIPQSSKIIKLLPLRKSLLVFAENGVWDIQGGDRGFLATDYTVTKISSVGCENPNTIIPIEDVCVYWSVGGIYMIQPDKTTGELNSVNIAEGTIQSLYLDIPSISKLYAVGHYDSANKKISWMYNDTISYNGLSYRNKYNKELVLNTALGAFVKNEFSFQDSETPYLSAYITTPNLLTSTTSEVITDSGVVVTDSAVDITSNITYISRGASSTKYLTFRQEADGQNSRMTFSQYSDETFHDWVTHDTIGVDYTSYLYTGYETHNDSIREKQATYLFMHFLDTNTGFQDDGSGGLIPIRDSSCLIQAQWAWSNSSNSGRWSSQFEGYRPKRVYIPDNVSDPYDTGFKTVETKSKIRGKGESLSLYFTSSEGKDMNLLGWAIPYVGEVRE